MSKSSKKKHKSAGQAEPGRKGPARGDWSGKPIEEMRPDELADRFGTIRGELKLPHPPGTLTIAMIVKNEAANIRAAVESFRPVADEIVIYDTGSTDGTQAILDELGVRWR